MISVEQIHRLESKVLQAVEVIKSLREENALLKNKLSGYEKRIEEMEILIDSFKKDQNNIEEGIINALNQLDVLEDIISEPSGEVREEVRKEETPLFGSTPAETDTAVSEDKGPESGEIPEDEAGSAEEEENSGESQENELDIF